MLGAQSATLYDGKSLLAVSGRAHPVLGTADQQRTTALIKPIVPQYLPASASTLAHVRCPPAYGSDNLSLQIEWSGPKSLDSREGVMIRSLAAGAAPVVAAVDKRGAVADRLVVSGGQILAELGLTARSMTELVGGITATLGILITASAGGVAIINDRNVLQVQHGSFGVSDELIGSALVELSEVATSTAEVFRSGITMVANDPAVDIPRFPEWVSSFGVNRLITMPITAGEQRLGVVHVANSRLPFTPDDIVQAERLLPFVASAVAHTQQRFELRQRQELVDVIGRAAAAIAGGLSVELLHPYLEEFRASLACDAIVLTMSAGQRCIAVGDLESHERQTGFVAGIDAESSELRSAMHRPVTPGEFGWVSMQAPVTVGGTVQATLALLRTPWLPFKRAERTAVRRMCEIIALGWTTHQLLDEQAEAARVTERLRIADDIHDRVAQLLFASKLALQNLTDCLPPDQPGAEYATQAGSLIARGDTELRAVIHHLADTAARKRALADDLYDIVLEVEQQFGREIDFDIADGKVLELKGTRRADAVLAAAREAMINAAKHAGPCAIKVVLESDSTSGIVVRVIDDGKGAPLLQFGYGLSASRRRLEEHGGVLSVNDRPSGGTEVVIAMSGTKSPGAGTQTLTDL